jgi:hypothetical protein
MNLEEKKTILFKDIEKHYDEFIRQSKMKLNRQYAPEHNSHLELVSDVIFSIVNKFDNEEIVDKYLEMYNDGMFFNYITKAINTNAKSLNAPFLYNKLKIRNRITIIENYKYDKETEDTQEKTDKQEIAEKIIRSFEPDIAPSIYGNEWRYYTKIYKEYIEDPNMTYSKISLKYNIPLGSIAYDMRIMKEMILDYIQKQNQNQNKNYENKNYEIF